MPETTLTAAEAAARLGVTERRIRALCAQGRFPGAINTLPEVPSRGTWRIPAEAVAAFQRRQPGRRKAE